MTAAAVVRGCGGYLPRRVVRNGELDARLDTSDAWIRQRSGIRARHLADEGELTSDLAAAAGRRAMVDAGITADDVDLLVVATATPDNTFPATAARVQAKLGITRGAAFDVQAVCSGFLFALDIAAMAVSAGRAATALVIGAETFSRILDWGDRTTAVLFGDGAGAFVVQRSERTAETGISCRIRTDGRLYDALYVDGGPSSGTMVGKLRMDGLEVFRHAVAKMTEIAQEIMADAGITPAEIDWLVPHQANSRIISTLASALGIATDRVLVTVDQHANTSAASIPLAIGVAAEAGKLRQGDLLLLVAAGAGMSWASALVRWGKHWTRSHPRPGQT
jgi:3-oxoacyl-[acyl-carrier-protein] synthase-3